MKIEHFLEYIKKSGSVYHSIIEAEILLKNAGFYRLDMSMDWDIKENGRYYVMPFDSMLIAFRIGDINKIKRLKIVATHGDFPCLRIKPNPEMEKENYMKLNIEVYGGPILNTWLDRPLSIAGKVALKSDKIFKPEIRYINIKKSVLTIPNLAIHMNKDVNKGVELNRQNDMSPIMALLNNELNKQTFFIDYLAKELDVSKEQILDFDLYIYNNENPEYIGINEEFISSPRLDNLSSAYCAIEGLIHAEHVEDLGISIIFDNEEVGSRTRQGAGSNTLEQVLMKVFASLGFHNHDYYKALSNSYLISADVSHGLHPNKADKNDPTNIAVLGKGIVVKLNARQTYLTDSESVAIFQQLCEARNIPYQKFVNKSDETSGSTLGPILTANVPVHHGVDVGVPLLAMHSARELMGTQDIIALYNLIQWFYEVKISN